jgi:hypothetical protein
VTVLLLFPSIHYVLRAEKVLQERGIPGTLVPVPPAAAADCGMSWSMPEEGLPAALQVLRGAGLCPEGVWTKEGSGWKPLNFGSA